MAPAEREVYDALARAFLGIHALLLYERLLRVNHRRWGARSFGNLRGVLLALQEKLNASEAPMRLYSGLPWSPVWMLGPPLSPVRRARIDQSVSEDMRDVMKWPPELADLLPPA